MNRAFALPFFGALRVWPALLSVFQLIRT